MGVRSPGDNGGVKELVKTKKKVQTQRPPLYKVLLHNDDYTPMEFVTAVLIQVFYMDETTAQAVMLAVHHNGIGVAGVYTRDIAETKARLVVSLAEQEGYPLLATFEEDQPQDGDNE